MKCSLKELFVLVIIYIAPTEGTQPALYLDSRSVQDKPMNLQQLRATINRLQDLDSFPVTSDSQLHKIVKKQMDASDYRGLRKNKRSVFLFPEKLPAFHISKVEKRSESRKANSDSLKPPENLKPAKSESFFSKLFNFGSDQNNGKTRNDANNQAKVKDKQKNEEKPLHHKDEVTKFQDAESDPKFADELKGGLVNVQEKKKKFNIAEEYLKQLQEADKKLTEMRNTKNLQDLEDEKNLMRFIEEEREKEINEAKKLEELIKQEREETIREAQKVQEVLQKNDMDMPVTMDKEKASKQGEQKIKENPCLKKEVSRIPDKNDYRYYYECESRPNGCMKLRHRRCPQGQFFSFKYLICLKGEEQTPRPKKRQVDEQKKMPWSHKNPDESEPSNEWLDATQERNTNKIPSEFKPKKKPELKIYHLRARRKLPQNEQLWARAESHRNTEASAHGKAHIKRHHVPRSFIVKINKKEGKDQIAENDDNEKENDEEDKESDDEEEEDEEEEAEEEEEESEEEEANDTAEKSRGKDGLRDLIKSAKEAVTKRAKFEDPLLETTRCTADQAGSKKSRADDKKKVLIDANIRVDSTLSSVVKSLLKNRRKESNSGFVGQDDSFMAARDQMDPVQLQNSYETLLKNNPRVKRYFLKRGVGEVAASGKLRTN